MAKLARRVFCISNGWWSPIFTWWLLHRRSYNRNLWHVQRLLYVEPQGLIYDSQWHELEITMLNGSKRFIGLLSNVVHVENDLAWDLLEVLSMSLTSCLGPHHCQDKLLSVDPTPTSYGGVAFLGMVNYVYDSMNCRGSCLVSQVICLQSFAKYVAWQWAEGIRMVLIRVVWCECLKMF